MACDCAIRGWENIKGDYNQMSTFNIKKTINKATIECLI